MSKPYGLQGHVALITGAGRRLGRAFALGLAECGADVIIHYGRSAEAAAETAAAARALGVRAITLQADLARPEQVRSLLPRASQALAEVDLLVNSASIFEPLDAMGTTLDAWQRHLDVNLTAPFSLSQALAGRLGESAGAIVNLLDWRALRPGPDHFPYTISKAALAAMTRALAVAFAPNIRVNGLALGAILPPADGGDAEKALRGVPAARWGTVEETVQALLFLLAGPSYITGTILHLDGGRHLT